MAFGSRSNRRGSRPLLVRWRNGAMSTPTTASDKKKESRTARILKPLLQRAPWFTHIVVLVLAIWGSTYFQYQVAFVYFTLHIVLVSSQLRTAYGMIRCLYFMRAFSATNWWNYYQEHIKTAPAEALETAHTPRTLPQLIVIPSYKESMATLTQTLSILASHPLAKYTYKVCLAMEEREAGSRAKGDTLRTQYQDKFLDITVSIHPSGLPGEVPGKGSNVGWGARWLVEREFMATASEYDDDDDDERTARSHNQAIPEGILTVMDADTAFASDYFLAAAVKYLLFPPEKRERTMFVPPIIFDRNQADVPGITRVTDIMWASVGIGGIYPSSLVKVPTSAYSVSIGLATHVGFWDTGAEAIGEDMHMFCKSLLDTRGHLHVETIYSPASQCNVIGPRFQGQTKFQRFMGDSKARWTQGVRHLWGSLDTAYVWTRFLTGNIGVSSQREAEHRLARLEMRKLVQQDRINDGVDRYASDSDYNANDYFTRPQTSKAGRVRLQVRMNMEENGEMELYRKKGNHVPGRHISRLPAWAASSGMVDTESSASSFISGDVSPPSPIDTQSDYSFSSVGDDGSPTNIETRPTIRSKNSRGAPTKRQLEAIGFTRDRTAAAPTPAEQRQKGTRYLPILVLLIRLYEAHLMIGHFVILVFLIVFWPPIRDLLTGNYTFMRPKADFWNWNLVEETWSWRDKDKVLVTAIEFSWRLGVLGCFAIVTIWIFHDRYHQEACKRWTSPHPAAVKNEKGAGAAIDEKMIEQIGTDNNAGFDPCELGLRPSPFSERKLPHSLYDYVNTPGGVLFGAIPLLYSHFWHLWTDKLAYTVSAKPTVNPVTVKELRE